MLFLLVQLATAQGDETVLEADEGLFQQSDLVVDHPQVDQTLEHQVLL